MSAAEVRRQLERIGAGVVDVVGEAELAQKIEAVLAGQRGPLRVKLGLDPSAPDLHIGHSITLEKLRVFQELGHTPIFLVGDFTARIGDPTGRSRTRPALDEAQIQSNAQTYLAQAAHFLDTERAECRFNSEWLDALRPAEFVRLCAHYTVARMLERDDFAKRYREGVAISVHEFLYPLLQAYDSVKLEADVELGGTDQRFNLLVGRELQRSFGKAPQVVITHPLLVGTDGVRKMSKSLDNTVGVTDTPGEIYGRSMSISDALMGDWLAQLSFGQWDDLQERWQPVAEGGGDPLALKQALARRLVERFHGEARALEAEAQFQRVVQQGQLPDEIPEHDIALDGAADIGLLTLLCRAFDDLASHSEARRLVEQGAVRIGDAPASDPAARVGPGAYLLRAGKRRYARVRLHPGVAENGP